MDRNRWWNRLFQSSLMFRRVQEYCSTVFQTGTPTNRQNLNTLDSVCTFVSIIEDLSCDWRLVVSCLLVHVGAHRFEQCSACIERFIWMGFVSVTTHSYEQQSREIHTQLQFRSWYTHTDIERETYECTAALSTTSWMEPNEYNQRSNRQTFIHTQDIYIYSRHDHTDVVVVFCEAKERTKQNKNESTHRYKYTHRWQFD